MKLISIIGARPQFIKAAPVSEALSIFNIHEKLIHTGQHFDQNMSQVFFDQMAIPTPHYNLGIHSLSHAEMTGSMMVAIEKILIEEMPDSVLVYGDTNSTLAGSLAAKKLQIPIIHVEAGLRSFNDKMPEEINRIVTDSISDFLYCPTQTAVDNLNREGISENAEVVLSGDVMYDALIKFQSIAQRPDGTPDDNFVLCTLHRQENTDDTARLDNIMSALNTIASSTKVVFPIHPRTKKLLGQQIMHDNIICIEPVGYLEMLYLLNRCSLVLSDSGGLQKEAFFSHKHCLILRTETEWVELVEAGFNVVVDDFHSKIVNGYKELSGKKFSKPPHLYGQGNAALKIAESLNRFFN